MYKMAQPTGEVPSLDVYTQREYIHRRLGKLIPLETRDLIDYGAAMGIFGIGFTLALSGQENKPLTLEVNGQVTPALRVTMDASPTVYDLGYEVGQVLLRSVGTDLERYGEGYAALSNFATAIEAITEHVSTFLYPAAKTAEVRIANRNSPLGRLILPPDKSM